MPGLLAIEQIRRAVESARRDWHPIQIPMSKLRPARAPAPQRRPQDDLSIARRTSSARLFRRAMHLHSMRRSANRDRQATVASALDTLTRVALRDVDARPPRVLRVLEMTERLGDVLHMRTRDTADGDSPFWVVKDDEKGEFVVFYGSIVQIVQGRGYSVSAVVLDLNLEFALKFRKMVEQVVSEFDGARPEREGE